MCVSDCIQITFFYLGRFLKKTADDQCSSISKGSMYHIKHNGHTTFYHVSGLTWNCMFNRSIYYVKYLHILPFNFVWQNCQVVIMCIPRLIGLLEMNAVMTCLTSCDSHVCFMWHPCAHETTFACVTWHPCDSRYNIIYNNPNYYSHACCMYVMSHFHISMWQSSWVSHSTHVTWLKLNSHESIITQATAAIVWFKSHLHEVHVENFITPMILFWGLLPSQHNLWQPHVFFHVPSSQGVHEIPLKRPHNAHASKQELTWILLRLTYMYI